MIEPRKIGQKPSLQSMMRRGELFFDSLDTTAQNEILARSRHMGQIASIAAKVAGEKTKYEGDGEAKQLVFAAYLSIGRFVNRAVNDIGIDNAKIALTSETAHHTLLQASRDLKSVKFDKVAKEFQRYGNWYDLDEESLKFKDGIHIPANYIGSGCPYTFGNQQRAEYFTRATDMIVDTYIQAHEIDMPSSFAQMVTRHLVRR